MTTFPDSKALGEELVEAVQIRSVSKVAEALKANADVNYIDSNGNTALHYACGTNQAEITSMLVKAGADSKITNNINESPVDIAIECGFSRIIDLIRKTDSQQQPVADAFRSKLIKPENGGRTGRA